MNIEKLDFEFSVCKLADFSTVDMSKEYSFTGRTDEENSLVCITQDVPDSTIEREDGFKAFRIQGTLDFSLIGILSKISVLLADNQIGIFAISTFNTDYILTKAEYFQKALDLLEKDGYTIL